MVSEEVRKQLAELEDPIIIHSLDGVPEKILVRHFPTSVDYWYVPERHAEKVIVANGATGHCNCSACGGLIGIQDDYCKHCGSCLEVD